MLHDKKSSTLGARRVSPPQPTCMSRDQTASYLADLRVNRPTRPGGSRPLPARPLPASDETVPPPAESALSYQSYTKKQDDTPANRKEQGLLHRTSNPTSNAFGSLSSYKGRPLVTSPAPPRMSSTFQREVSPPTTLAYRESNSRLKERAEAQALREALEKTDESEGDEQRIHEAAKQEAADLVWKHRNPNLAELEKTAAYHNPDLPQQRYGPLNDIKKLTPVNAPQSVPQSRSSSGESTTSVNSKRHRLPWLQKRPKPNTTRSGAEITILSQPEAKQETILQKGVRKTSEKRQISSGSSKGVFRNPEDEIYEEPETILIIPDSSPKHTLPLKPKNRNSLPRGSRPLPEKSQTDSALETLRHNRGGSWKVDLAQSSRTAHVVSRALPQTPMKETEIVESSPRYKDGYEIRGDDIRAATSMKKSDRSPNLPTPTAVSDRLGRPIVSFDPKWRPGNESPRASRDLDRPQVKKEDGSVAYPVKPTLPIPEITILEDPRSPALQTETTHPAHNIVVPSIDISAAHTPVESPTVPRISLPGEDFNKSGPTITVESKRPQIRPLPTTSVANHNARPLPLHSQSSPPKLPPSRPVRPEFASRVPWLARTPTSASTSSVSCTSCTLSIAGRIVTATGSANANQKARFHPECFTCHNCSTGLECVSFYPEPDSARSERCQIQLPHLSVEEAELWVKGNEDLHFFCHLDYHELFSPRCFTCKTPVEGAVVLALGRHYHQDHFFCAECGDPFSATSPFVEHNSYPYCVSCHTKRTSARCRACKAPILNEMTVEALDGKWHNACFVCCDCGGDFGEEGRFFVREVIVELTEKEKRKGYGPKVEEKAACQVCEELRIKNVNIFL